MHAVFSTILLETTDESYVRNRHARRRPRDGPGRHRRTGPGRQAYDQGTEDDDGAHGEEQPREVLRRRRARQERLRRGRPFLRGAVDARPGPGLLRARAERRLPEARGRQNPGVVIPAAAGIGLRFPHHGAVLEEKPAAAWLEVHAENYMGGGKALMVLDAVRRDYPLSLHGVGLSLGSADGLNERHLARLRNLAQRVDPGLVSEHLSWSATGGAHFSDLLPLPFTEEALSIVCRNVEAAQDFLGRRILDDHGSRVSREVWALYAEALAVFGRVPTLIEWDTDVPPLAVLLDEAAQAQRIMSEERA